MNKIIKSRIKKEIKSFKTQFWGNEKYSAALDM